MVDLNRILKLLDKAAIERGQPFGWEPRRVLGAAFYFDDDELDNIRKEIDRLWFEVEDQGEYVAAAFCEEPGTYFVSFLKGFEQKATELVDLVRGQVGEGANFRLTSAQVSLVAHLQKLGYKRTEFFTHQLSQGCDIRETPSVNSKYKIGNMSRDEEDFAELARMLNESFKRSYHNAGEYRNFQKHNARYRNDLDFIAKTADGKIVANVAFSLFGDDRFAILEPASVHPEHQRQGLSKRLIAEGINLLAGLGVERVFVEASHSKQAALATYLNSGFVEYDREYLWATPQ